VICVRREAEISGSRSDPRFSKSSTPQFDSPAATDAKNVFSVNTSVIAWLTAICLWIAASVLPGSDAGASNGGGLATRLP